MNDAEADRYVYRALATREGEPAFEIVVGLPSVPAIVRAFERRGWVAETGEIPGRLRLGRLEAGPCPHAEACRLGKELLRGVRVRGLSNARAAEWLGTVPEDVSLLRRGRFEEIGAERLTEMAERISLA